MDLLNDTVKTGGDRNGGLVRLDFADLIELRNTIAGLDEPLFHCDLLDPFANVGQVERDNLAILS